MLRASASARPGIGPTSDAHDAPDLLGRIESWVAGNLDGPRGPGDDQGRDDWHRRAIAILDPRGTRPDPTREMMKAAPRWSRIGVTQKKGVTVVRPLDKTLVREADLGEFADELSDLIAAGHHRVALDFSGVERLTCQVLPVLERAAKACREPGDGLLKVFHLGPDVSPLLGLSPMTRMVEAPADEAAALDGPWPSHSGPRPLPEALLAGLAAWKQGRSPSPCPRSPSEADPMTDATAPAATSAASPSCLIVEDGRSAPRAVAITEAGIVVGRDPGCSVHSNHAFLSRRHLAIRTCSGRVLARDLGSTNGTLLNGSPLGPGEVEVGPSDRLNIGPFSFRVGRSDDGRCRVDEDEIAGWLSSDDEAAPALASAITREDTPVSRSARVEIIEDVVVVTPIAPEFLNAAEPSTLRDELSSLVEGHAPPRIVLNLEHVSRVSNVAVGVLVAFHLRLETLGGSLRLCQPHARVAQVLEQIRLPLLLDVFPTMEDAVLSAWERGDREAG